MARGVAAYDRRMIQFVHSGPCAYGSSRPTETKPPRPPSAAWLEVVSAGSWDPSADGGDGHIWPLYCENAVLILPSLVHHVTGLVPSTDMAFSDARTAVEYTRPGAADRNSEQALGRVGSGVCDSTATP